MSRKHHYYPVRLRAAMPHLNPPSDDDRVKLHETACSQRWKRIDIGSAASSAAMVAGKGTVVAVAVTHRTSGTTGVSLAATAQQIFRLSALLHNASGGDVVVGVRAAADERPWHFLRAAGIAVVMVTSTTMSVRNNIWRLEATARNEVLDALSAATNQTIAAVLSVETGAAWCAEDALRMISQLARDGGEGADLVCAARHDDNNEKGAFLYTEDMFAPKHVDERMEATCDARVRPAASHFAPRDAWTGDLCPNPISSSRTYDASKLRQMWPARVLSCWSELVAISSGHLFENIESQNLPPLRFRVAVRGIRECDAPPVCHCIRGRTCNAILTGNEFGA